jgi:hypothetical protein
VTKHLKNRSESSILESEFPANCSVSSEVCDRPMITITILFSVITLAISGMPYAYAGGRDDSEACYDLGYDQGRDKPFQRGNYDSCERFREDYDGKNPYYECFIDGCKSIERNKEEICESVTD